MTILLQGSKEKKLKELIIEREVERERERGSWRRLSYIEQESKVSVTRWGQYNECKEYVIT